MATVINRRRISRSVSQQLAAVDSYVGPYYTPGV